VVILEVLFMPSFYELGFESLYVQSLRVVHGSNSNSCNLLHVYTKMAFAFETLPAANQTLLTKPLPAFTSERNTVYR
jgi:hypothetical protein